MSDRPDLSRIWASNGSKRDPGAVKYAVGWIDEIPTYQVLNYLQWRNDISQLALAERGVPQWGSDVTYVIDALAWDDTNNRIYIRKTAGSSTVVPSLDATNWDLSAAQLTAAELQAAVDLLNTHVTATGNPHEMTPADINAYSKLEIDDKFATADSALTEHKNNVSNPHNVTAAQAGGVPITGGTYTGPVEFNAEETTFTSGSTNAAIRANANGFYLRLGADLLGIDATGMANFNGNPLVTEATYVAVRQESEPAYAVPTPDCSLLAISDINMREGYGFTDFTGTAVRVYTNKSGKATSAALDEPRYTARGLMIDATVEAFKIDADQNLVNFKDATVVFVGSQGRAEATTFWEDSSARTDRFWATNLGELKLTVENSVGVPTTVDIGTVAIGTDFRVAMTLSATKLKVYLNGSLVSEITNTYIPAPTYDYIKIGTLGLTYLKRFQTWARVLTHAQITTL